MRSSVRKPLASVSTTIFSMHCAALAVTSPRGTVNEMSVWPAVDTFCTIMSTLTPASARSRKTVAATPGRSGTCSIVIFASEMSCVTPEMIACSIDSVVSIGSSVTHVPGAHVKLERTCTVHAVVARELDRTQREHPAAGRGHLEHLVERDTRELARGRHDARVGGVHAFDVGVDLAQSASSAAASATAVVSEPPRPSVVMSRAVDTPWKPATIATSPVGQRLADAVAADLDDLRLAVVGVGDDAGLAPGEATAG